MKKTSVVAWTLAGIISIVSVINIVALLINSIQQPSLFTLLSNISFLILPIGFSALAALIVSSQPGNAVGWLLYLPALTSNFPVDAYIKTFIIEPAEPPPLLLLGLWYSGWSWLLLIFPILFIPVLFPTGQPPSPRWRWLIYAGLGMCMIFILLATFTSTFSTENQNMTWSVANPIGFLPDVGDLFLIPWISGLLLLTVLSVTSVFVRYRHASSVEREQIKWLLFACSIFAVFYIGTGVIRLINAQLLASELFSILLVFLLLAFPASIAIAILRYRLWDINVIIRKSLVYGVLTSLLVLVFFSGVTLLQLLFNRLTGANESPVAIVISTLAIWALFNPLRSRLQTGIDRRFYRRKYNAQKVIDAFAATARNEVELEQLTDHLLKVIDQTMQPEQVMLWFNAETFQSQAGKLRANRRD